MSTLAVTQFPGVAAVHVTCWCSISFAVSQTLYEFYTRKAGAWSMHCPLGHTFVPAGPSEAQQLRDQLAREKHYREQADERVRAANARADHIEHRRRGTLGALRKTQKRVKHGVCPCCNRTFQNLARHMTGQHPHYGASAEAETAS